MRNRWGVVCYFVTWPTSTNFDDGDKVLNWKWGTYVRSTTRTASWSVRTLVLSLTGCSIRWVVRAGGPISGVQTVCLNYSYLNLPSGPTALWFTDPKKFKSNRNAPTPVVISLTSGSLVPKKHVNKSPVTLLGHKVVHVAQQGESVKVRVVISSRHFFCKGINFLLGLLCQMSPFFEVAKQALI